MTDPEAPREETDAERRARHRFDAETAAGPASITPTEPKLVDDADEGTSVVDRRPAPADEPEDGPEDGTVVVDRWVEPEDGTIVVDRSAPDDGTVVVDRSADPDDGTLVLERPAVPAKRGPVMRTLPRRGARREVTVAPGDGANKTATLAPGAGAVAAYDARALPAAPAATPQIELGPEASRANAPSMPSIAKQSRRRGLIALAVTAGAILVSLVGLVLVVGALISG